MRRSAGWKAWRALAKVVVLELDEKAFGFEWNARVVVAFVLVIFLTAEVRAKGRRRINAISALVKDVFQALLKKDDVIVVAKENGRWRKEASLK